MKGPVARLGGALVNYLVACIAAAVCYTLLVVISVQVIGVEHPSELNALQQMTQLIWFTFLVTLFVIALAFVPAIVAISILGLLKLQHLVWYVAAGIAVSAIGVLLAARYVPLMDRMQFDWVMALAGAAGGIAYRAMSRQFSDNRISRHSF